MPHTKTKSKVYSFIGYSSNKICGSILRQQDLTMKNGQSLSKMKTAINLEDLASVGLRGG